MIFTVQGGSLSFALLAVTIGATCNAGCSASAPEATGTASSAVTTPVTPAPPAATGVLPPEIQAIAGVAGAVGSVFRAYQAISFLVQLTEDVPSVQSELETLQTDLMNEETGLTNTLSKLQWNLVSGTCDSVLLGEQGDLQSILEQVSQGQTVSDSETAFTDTSVDASQAQNHLCFNRLASPFTLWPSTQADLTSIGNPPADTTPVLGSATASGEPLYLYWQWVLGAPAPDANGNVYDWRLGVPGLFEAIAMRIVAIGAYDPTFTTDGVYTKELTNYRTILQSELKAMLAGVQCGFQARDVMVPMGGAGGSGLSEDGCLGKGGLVTVMLTCADINTGLNVTKDFTSASVGDDAYITQSCNLQSSGASLTNALNLSVASNSAIGQMQAEVLATGDLDIMRRQILVQMPIFETQAMINTLYVYTRGGADLEYPQTPRIVFNYDYYRPDSTSSGRVLLSTCGSQNSQQFVYDRRNSRIYNSKSGLDLTVINNQLGTGVSVQMANLSQPPGAGQMWTYDPEKEVILNKLGTVLAGVPKPHRHRLTDIICATPSVICRSRPHECAVINRWKEYEMDLSIRERETT